MVIQPLAAFASFTSQLHSDEREGDPIQIQK